MKKSFLLCLMTLLGVIGMYAAAPASGTGTEADPYIVENGTTYSNPAQSRTYISFTAPSAGTLTLNFKSNFYMGAAFATIDGRSLKRETDYSTYNRYKLEVENGMTYVIFGNNVFAAVDIEVTFEANADAITGTAVPATGSTLDKLTSTLINPDKEEDLGVMNTKYPITLTLSKAVGFVSANWSDGKDFSTSVRGHNYDIAVEYERQTSTGGSMGESQGDQTGEVVPEFYLGEKTSTTWNIGPEIPTDQGKTSQEWVLYNDRPYTLTVQLWNSQIDWEQRGTPIGVVTITYNGSTEAPKYSTMKLTKVYPNPNLTNPKDEHLMLSWEDGRDQAVLLFDGYVSKVEAGAAGGQGAGEIPCDVQYIYYGESDGNINETAVLVTIPEQTDGMTGNPAADVSVNVYAWDKDGLPLDDAAQTGEFEFNKTSNKFELSFPFKDGRINPTSLEYEERTPEEQYVTKLDAVTLAYNTSVMINPNVREMEGLGLYKGDEKVADILFKVSYDTDKDTSPSQVTMTFVKAGTITTDEKTGAETGEAYTVEEGDYELRIPELVIANTYINWDTPWTNSMQGIGECNPAYAFKYSVVESLPEYVSADPAPYVSGGEYNEELPANVTVEFSEAIKEATATVRYGMNSVVNVPAENIKVEGSNVTFAVPAEALKDVSYTLNIHAVNEAGVPVTYGEQEGQVLLTYQLNPAQLELTFTPASGETVKSLSQIYVKGTIDLGFGESTISVKDANDNEVTTASLSAMGNDGTTLENWDELFINLAEDITEAGTYTIEIPEGEITSLDETQWNAAIKLTYIVDPTLTGIENAQAANVTEVDVYTVDGALFAKGVKSNEVKTLPAGVYVVNGRKVAVR